jgi:hypothetical protein
MMKALLLVGAIALSSCTKHAETEAVPEEPQLVDALPEDFIVPEVIWESMQPPKAHEEKAGGGHGESSGGHEGGAAPAEKEKPILYTSVKILLKEKNKGVLKKPNLAFEFARGGGEMDLSKLMGSHQGTFFISFELPEFENVLQKKAFFISQSRQRKVDGEVIGSGCRKVLDVSTQLYKQSKEAGLKINTTRDRQDSVLGGHMIFLGETEKNWLLTQVTFFDSARTDLFCKGFRTVQLEVR